MQKADYPIWLSWLILSLAFSTPCLADFLGYPKLDGERYPNPYMMMDDPRVGKKRHHEEAVAWEVVSKQANAPIYLKTSSGFESSGERAGYLQVFNVLERKGRYLHVRAVLGDAKKGRWMHMKDLILVHRSIRDPFTRVDLKVFPLVKIGHREAKSLDVLRFRNGPGDPGENEDFEYLNTRDEAIRAGNLFLYVYAASFKDDDACRSNGDCDRYANIGAFGEEYYLVGTSPGLTIEDGRVEEGVIKGWLPSPGAALWDTRQALEVAADRNRNQAHIFSEEPQLKQYFDTPDTRGKERFLDRIKDDVLEDGHHPPPSSGRELRYILIEKLNPFNSVEYAQIGYTGRRKDGRLTPILPRVDEREITPEDIQIWGKNVDVFFLIDATASMAPCIEAAALVVEKIMEELAGDMSVSFHAAVFRDKRDGDQRFVEWDPDYDPDLQVWLRSIETKTFHPPDPTFEEALYYGIQQAARSWKRTFKYKVNPRVMFILGDTGNDAGDTISSEQVARELKENLIIPKAIRFVHKPKNDGEKKAMDLFSEHIEAPLAAAFEDPRLLGVTEVDVNAPRGDEGEVGEDYEVEMVKNTLNAAIEQSARTARWFVNELVDVRLGQKTIIELLCDKGWPGAMNEECKARKNLPDIIDFIAENRELQHASLDSSGEEVDIGFPVALLTLLGDRCPDCLEWLNTRPEAGFAEGYVAVNADNEPITRPVLLLSHRELLKINYTTKILIEKFEMCNKKEVHKHLVRAMTTILGEILGVDPEEVTREEMRRWFYVVVNPGDAMIGDLTREICRTGKWKELRKSLGGVSGNIERIVGEYSHARLYADPAGIPHFWVYPEEVFPPAGE